MMEGYMGYINDVMQPQLVYVGEDIAEIMKISKQVEKLNEELVDSGFDQYKYSVRVNGKCTYIERVL